MRDVSRSCDWQQQNQSAQPVTRTRSYGAYIGRPHPLSASFLSDAGTKSVHCCATDPIELNTMAEERAQRALIQAYANRIMLIVVHKFITRADSSICKQHNVNSGKQIHYLQDRLHFLYVLLPTSYVTPVLVYRLNCGNLFVGQNLCKTQLIFYFTGDVLSPEMSFIKYALMVKVKPFLARAQEENLLPLFVLSIILSITFSNATELAQCAAFSCSQPQPDTDNGAKNCRSN